MRKFNFIDRLLSSCLWYLQHIAITRRFSNSISDYLHPYFLNKFKKLGHGRIFKVDEVTSISPFKFFISYFLKGKPLIFKGAAKKWASANWTFSFLKEKYGHESTTVTDYGEMKETTLKETIEDIEAGTIKNARVSALIQNNKSLMKDNDLKFLNKYTFFPSFTTSYQFFIGTKNNFTPLHSGMTNNFSIQLYGKKRWRLIDTKQNPLVRPILDGGPLIRSDMELTDSEIKNNEVIKYLDIWEAELDSGDILFNPSFLWHFVEYQSNSITAGLRWLNPYSVLKSSVTMGLIVLTAYNPSAFESFRKIRKGASMSFFR